MRLPPSRRVLPWSVLLAKEWAGLRAGRAFWVLLLVQALLAGAGYTQAVALYAEASRAALEAPDLAAGLSPLEGVAVPTFGSLYLGLTLLWPFVVIRLIGRERAEGTLALLLQTRVPLAAWLAAKLAVLGAGALLLLLIPGSALALWLFAGGHLGVGETLALILGYALYAVLVTGVAALAAALMDSAASAAILTLSVTLGAWALDFAAAGDRGCLHALGALSPTVVLRQFENGLVTFASTAGLLVAGLAALVLAGLWLAPGARRGKLASTAGVVAVAVAAGALAAWSPASWDASENRRHSFSPGDEVTLSRLSQPLAITVHLSPDDPRLHDLERNVLDKLGRVLPAIEINVTGSGGPFAAPEDERYGLIELRYAGRRAETRSTSPREILPLIYDLAGVASPEDGAGTGYPGYPRVADAAPARLWFHVILPVFIGLAWWRWGRP